MEMVLIAVVVVSLAISFLCSLMEAAILTVPLGYVKSQADQKHRSGKILMKFKRDIGSPISAILILNTISHTVGAAVSGALVGSLYGEEAVLWFSALFTVLILYLSEIIPKQFGAVYFKQVSLWIAELLNWMVKLFYPIILTTKWVANWITKMSKEPSVSVQEILSMIKIGSEEGILDTLESSVIRNIILLDRVTAKQVLTPRSVVYKLPEDMTLAELKDQIGDWNHSRVPVYSRDNADTILGYVIQRDLFREMLRRDGSEKISEFARTARTIPDSMPLDKLFVQMIESREPICLVVDEYGVFTGLVTMEDIIEEIVGKEIVDEYDIIGDLQAYARALYLQRRRKVPEQFPT